MKKALLFLSLLVMSSAALAGEIRVKGIVCEGAPDRNGVVPFLMIKDIGKVNASLYLNLDGGLPDIRNSTIKKTISNGKEVATYISHDSAFNPGLRNFVVNTNGTTQQNTTAATLQLEGRSEVLQLTCVDGMTL